MSNLFKIEYIDTTKSYFNVKFINQVGDRLGNGYLVKGTKNISLEVCPSCRLQNYSVQVHSGTCAYCNFSANELEK